MGILKYAVLIRLEYPHNFVLKHSWAFSSNTSPWYHCKEVIAHFRSSSICSLVPHHHFYLTRCSLTHITHELSWDWLILDSNTGNISWKCVWLIAPCSILLFPSSSLSHYCFWMFFFFSPPPHTRPRHSPVWETSAVPFVWQTGASKVWWSNLPQMYRTWVMREMSFMAVENTAVLLDGNRGAFPFITSPDTSHSTLTLSVVCLSAHWCLIFPTFFLKSVHTPRGILKKIRVHHINHENRSKVSRNLFYQWFPFPSIEWQKKFFN